MSRICLSLLLILFSTHMLTGQSLDITLTENGQQLKKRATFVEWSGDPKSADVRNTPKKAKKGKPMIDFIGVDAAGNSFDTKDFKGKFIVLEFSATWCGACWIEYPLISLINKRFPGIEFITFNLDEDSDKWSQIAEKDSLDVNWTVLWDSERKSEVFSRYKARAFPTYYLISPQGEVMDKWLGAGGLLNRLIINNILKVEDRKTN